MVRGLVKKSIADVLLLTKFRMTEKFERIMKLSVSLMGFLFETLEALWLDF